jgi:hypothetical protein
MALVRPGSSKNSTSVSAPGEPAFAALNPPTAYRNVFAEGSYGCVGLAGPLPVPVLMKASGRKLDKTLGSIGKPLIGFSGSTQSDPRQPRAGGRDGFPASTLGPTGTATKVDERTASGATFSIAAICNTPCAIVGTCGQLLMKKRFVQTSTPVNFFNNGQFVTNFFYDHGNTGDANCPTPATQCLVVTLTNPGLPGESLGFTQGIVGAPGLVGSGGKTVSVDKIATAGATITYKFSDGLIITSDLAPFGCCELFADSQHPNATVPAQIDRTLFVGTGLPPCTPTDGTTCPNPRDTGGSDGNPYEELQPPSTNPG